MAIHALAAVDREQRGRVENGACLNVFYIPENVAQGATPFERAAKCGAVPVICVYSLHRGVQPVVRLRVERTRPLAPPLPLLR